MERCSIESIFSMLVPGRYKWYLYLMETGTYIAMRCHVLGYCREIISNILTRFLKTQSTKEKERFTHPRKDSIQYFFYFQAELHNKMVRLNIAQRIRVKDNGKRDFPLFYKWRDKEIGKEASKATVRSLNASVQFLWYFFIICKKNNKNSANNQVISEFYCLFLFSSLIFLFLSASCCRISSSISRSWIFTFLL